MIWNPWKEIAKLREEIVNLKAEVKDEKENSALWLHMLNISREIRFEKNEVSNKRQNEIYRLVDVLRAIIAEENPNSIAEVTRICQIAREAISQ